jgi:3-hydroxybutyryl-CoA dehydratase
VTAERMALEFAQLDVGMEAETEVVWTREDLEAFRSLTGDDAPVHWDEEFAASVGMPGTIVYGLLVAAPFSTLLGCSVPGPLSVIHSLRVDFARPALVGEPLRYRVAVAQLSPSTRSVILELSVVRPDGTFVLRGKAQCVVAR